MAKPATTVEFQGLRKRILDRADLTPLRFDLLGVGKPVRRGLTGRTEISDVEPVRRVVDRQDIEAVPAQIEDGAGKLRVWSGGRISYSSRFGSCMRGLWVVWIDRCGVRLI